MSLYKTLALSLLVTLLSVTASEKTLNILPRPNLVELMEGELSLPQKWTFNNSSVLQVTALKSLKKSLPASFKLSGAKEQTFLNFKFSPNSFPVEAYRLEINAKGIHIEASSASGFFYAVQSLIQILPTELKIGDKVPYCRIEDQPRFKQRGMLLDSGRQYHTMKFLKQFIDALARLKMNTFHWHLNDYSGWRLAIDKYPKLTEIGSNITAYKQPEQKGFYSKDEVRELIK